MNIDEMPAGRELDALVAEKVMGSPKHQWVEGIGQPDILGDYEGCSYCECRRKPERETDVCIKQYSTDIAAAWEVVKKRGRPISIGMHGETWVVNFYSAMAFGDTAPLAICRAALKAVM